MIYGSDSVSYLAVLSSSSPNTEFTIPGSLWMIKYTINNYLNNKLTILNYSYNFYKPSCMTF